MKSDELENERKNILEILDILHKEYRKAVKPWLDKLAEIEAVRLSNFKTIINPKDCIQDKDIVTRTIKITPKNASIS